MRSGELARQAGVNVQTLRYYERIGLLPEPSRRPSGYREYTRSDVSLVRFVKRAQELGFTLADIEDLLALADGGPDNCDGVRVLADSKIAVLDRRIEDLRTMRDSLARLIATCELPRPQRECPILSEIEQVRSGEGSMTSDGAGSRSAP